jgi:hypothetical protein
MEAEMVAVIEDDSHFVPWDRLAHFRADDSMHSAYQRLNERNAGAGVIFEGEWPRCYVTSAFLKGATFALAGERGLGNATQLRLRDYITAFLDGAGTWHGRIVASVNLVTRRFYFAPVSSTVLRPDSENEAYIGGSPQVYAVADAMQRIGWLFNHESLRDPIFTPPDRWRCQDGHWNADPDAGNCSQCPKPLVD